MTIAIYRTYCDILLRCVTNAYRVALWSACGGVMIYRIATGANRVACPGGQEETAVG